MNHHFIKQSLLIISALLIILPASTQTAIDDPTLIPPMNIKSNRAWISVPDGTSDEGLKKLIEKEIKSNIDKYQYRYEETAEIFEKWMLEKQELNDKWKSKMLELNSELREAISKVSRLRQESVVMKNELDVMKTRLEALRQTIENDSLSLGRYLNEKEFVEKNLKSQLEDITYMVAVMGRRPLGTTEILDDVLNEIGDKMLNEAIKSINETQITSEQIVKDKRLIRDMIVSVKSGHGQVLDSYTNDFAHEPPSGGDIRYLVQAIEVSPFKEKKGIEKTAATINNETKAYIFDRTNLEEIWNKEYLNQDQGKNDLKTFILKNIISQAEKHNKNVGEKIEKIYNEYLKNLWGVDSRIENVRTMILSHRSELNRLENEYADAKARYSNYDINTLIPAIEQLKGIEKSYRHHSDNRVFFADKTEEGKVITSISDAYCDFGSRTVNKIKEFKEAEYSNSIISVDYKLASYKENLMTYCPSVRAFTILYLCKKTYSKSLNYIACVGYQRKLNPTTTISGTSYGQDRIAGPIPGMTFVTIPSGRFQMGSNEYYDDEKPVHNVYIKAFKMMMTEVTQAQWTAVMGNNPSNWKGDDLPVEQVSWNDIQEFIRKLNQLDPGKGYRLPTEAEWEYACRAGTTTKYYSGNSDTDLGRAGWYSGNSGSRTHPVALKEPNSWGLYDMHGNVWEWCEDWYHDRYNGVPTDGSAWLSPSGQYRVLRGGSWSGPPGDCRSAARGRAEPGARGNYSGFRLCASL